MIAVFGTGAMGTALLSGLLDAGTPPSTLVIVDPDSGRAGRVAEQFGVRAVTAAEAATAGVLLIVVPPQAVPAVLREVSPTLAANSLVVSCAAGVPIRRLEELLPADTAVIRAMPNAAVVAHAGMSVLSRGTSASDEDLKRAAELLGAVGEVLVVPEAQQDAATALSGSGPAYFYEFFDALITAGTAQGLTNADATTMVLQAAAGAVAMARHTGHSPAKLRDQVATPGGTTRAALDVLAERGVPAAIGDAVAAATARSRELAGNGG